MDQSAELLNQLKDIELPERSGFWIAPGWILLFILTILICWILWLVWRHYAYRRQTDWRPEARVEIALIREKIESGDYEMVLSASSQLARRIALALEARSDVAELTGDNWLRKLDDLAGNHQFTEGPGRLLKSAPYRAGNIEDKPLLLGILDAIESLIDNNVMSKEVQAAGKMIKNPRHVSVK